VSPLQLSAMRELITQWVEESRGHSEPFGPECIDGRPRFDMGAEHSPSNPALRRVNNPADLYDPYREVMQSARVVDMVADLIGPNVKFHHDKINLKLPGAATEVPYHQDFLFTPHTNDDVVTALMMLDDVTLENGCLMVVPGTHRGELHTLFDEKGSFAGRMREDITNEMKAVQIPVTGPAGSVCLMHTRLAHGSAPNSDTKSRNLYICVYSAADAVPLARNPMPGPLEGTIVRGVAARKARLGGVDLSEVELPQQPKSGSFFTLYKGQESKSKL